MANASPENLQAGNLGDKYVYAFTIGLMNEEPIQDFIDRVRGPEGIIPPENAED